MQTGTLSPASKIHIARAQKRFPDLELIKGLVADVESARHDLARRTVGVYQHEYRTIIAAVAARDAEGSVGYVDAAERIQVVLAARVADDVPARTAAKKAKSITAGRLRRLFVALKTKALAENSRSVAVVGLMVAALATLGLRPVELTSLEECGGFLRIQSAKSSAKRPRYRYFDARAVPQPLLAAMVMAAKIYGEATEPEEFAQRHRMLSQILGRVSVAELDERICFYVFRHLALATWKRAKISAADIAELAGHLDPSMARHYAGAAAGLPGPILIKAIKAGSQIEAIFPDTPFSALIKPPRGPRKAALSDTEHNTKTEAESETAEVSSLIPIVEGPTPSVPALATDSIAALDVGVPSQDSTDDDDDPGLDLDALDIYAASTPAPVADVPPKPGQAAGDTTRSIAAVTLSEPEVFSEFGPLDMPPPVYKTAPRPERPPGPREQARLLQEQREMNRQVDELIAADDRRIASLKAARLAASRQSSSPNRSPPAPDEDISWNQDTPSGIPPGPGGRR